MTVARTLEEIAFDKNSVVTVGTFDGMHLAHRAIVRTVVDHAAKRKGRSVVVTFHPHPRQVLRKDGSPIALLSTLEERIEACSELGVDTVVVLEFTPAFSELSAREFYESIVVERIGVSEAVEGYDHHFGHNRTGSVAALKEFGLQYGFLVHTIDALYVDRELVSSSAREGRSGRIALNVSSQSRPFPPAVWMASKIAST